MKPFFRAIFFVTFPTFPQFSQPGNCDKSGLKIGNKRCENAVQDMSYPHHARCPIGLTVSPFLFQFAIYRDFHFQKKRRKKHNSSKKQPPYILAYVPEFTFSTVNGYIGTIAIRKEMGKTKWSYITIE